MSISFIHQSCHTHSLTFTYFYLVYIFFTIQCTYFLPFSVYILLFSTVFYLVIVFICNSSCNCLYFVMYSMYFVVYTCILLYIHVFCCIYTCNHMYFDVNNVNICNSMIRDSCTSLVQLSAHVTNLAAFFCEASRSNYIYFIRQYFYMAIFLL